MFQSHPAGKSPFLNAAVTLKGCSCFISMFCILFFLFLGKMTLTLHLDTCRKTSWMAENIKGVFITLIFRSLVMILCTEFLNSSSKNFTYFQKGTFSPSIQKYTTYVNVHINITWVQHFIRTRDCYVLIPISSTENFGCWSARILYSQLLYNDYLHERNKNTYIMLLPACASDSTIMPCIYSPALYGLKFAN